MNKGLSYLNFYLRKKGKKLLFLFKITQMINRLIISAQPDYKLLRLPSPVHNITDCIHPNTAHRHVVTALRERSLFMMYSIQVRERKSNVYLSERRVGGCISLILSMLIYADIHITPLHQMNTEHLQADRAKG